jgi:predicted RecA/RadA family phage recombinase
MYIIDRIEGNWLVVEAGKATFNLPKELAPAAKEGDVVHIAVSVDQAATLARQKAASHMLDDFFDK